MLRSRGLCNEAWRVLSIPSRPITRSKQGRGSVRSCGGATLLRKRGREKLRDQMQEHHAETCVPENNFWD